MHDLALAIGGFTVKQLKKVLTLDELKCWRMYEQEFGPFNLALRMERIVGLAAAPHLKGHPFKKLAPWPAEPQQASGGIEEAFGILMMSTRRKGGRKS